MSNDHVVNAHRESISFPLSIPGLESEDEEVYEASTEGPVLAYAQSLFSIDDRFEHCHAENQDEFQLIPHVKEPDAWKTYIPILYWLPKYQWKEWFIYDLISAITSTVMVIPQGMGYALIAGLEPIYGLYTGLMGHCLYSMFGTSGQVIYGAVAVVSLMIKEILHEYFPDNHHHDKVAYAAYASCISFQVGIITLCLGLAKAGSLAHMLAEPVMVGFMTAAVILIGLSQMQFIFKIEVEGEKVMFQVESIAHNISKMHFPSFILGLGCMIILILFQIWKNKATLPLSKFAKYIPSALIVVVIGTLISASIGTQSGFDIVDDLPNGLPKFRNFFSYVESTHFWNLWSDSLLISLISLIETVAIATKFADKHDYSINLDQEMIALGLVNIIGCWFQIYPSSGILSTTAVVESAGARTPFTSVMAGIFLIFSIEFLLFLFTWLPKPILGGIVLIGIINLLDLDKIKEIYQINRRDFMVMVITIILTLFLGIEYGVIMGTICSIIMFIQRESKPHYGILGIIESDDNNIHIYRNIKHHPEAIVRDDMLIIRWDASIFFANVESFKKKIRKQIGRFLFKNDFPSKYCLVLCFSGVNDIDYSGLDGLRAFFKELLGKERGMTLLICKLKEPIYKLFKESGVIDIIGDNQILWELHEAEKWWDIHKSLISTRHSSAAQLLLRDLN